MRSLWWLLAFLMLTATAGSAIAQENEEEQLAKQLSNPVADLVSVPFQFNFENGVGPDEATRMVLNIQPVVPFSISKNWNLIGRWIMPIVSQPPLAPGMSSSYGMSDIIASAFFSPKQSKTIWGVGPVIGIPTNVDPALGSGKWLAGPTFVVLRQPGQWTYGALANHLWSFADASNQDRASVNRGYVQPFIAYTTKKGITTTVVSETTYDHAARDGERWTIPVILNVGKVTKFGPFPFQIQAGAGYYFDSPEGGPEWKLRTNFVLLLPVKK